MLRRVPVEGGRSSRVVHLMMVLVVGMWKGGVGHVVMVVQQVGS